MTFAKPNWPPRPANPVMPLPKKVINVAAILDHHSDSIAKWPAADRWKLRQLAVNTLLEVMRDCPDRKVRADAFRVLVKMGIAQP